MEIGISERGRQLVAEGLAKVLAETYALYLKTQNFHWNVTGSDFFALHLLFEKQYEDMAEATDEIAERIRAFGHFVDATFGGFKKLSSIHDENQVLTAREMLDHLVKGHELAIRHMREVSSIAEKENDQGTIDLLGKRLREHEKMAWMLRSHL